MGIEVVEKKLEQIKELLKELSSLLSLSFEKFQQDLTMIRAAERNFID